MPGIDFSKRYSDYARFLPAVSEMYTRFVVNPNPKRNSPIPQSDLDFFNKKSNLWYLPCALYSAGQAAKSEGAAKRKDMITGRANKSTTVLGDSGGFQIQQGSIKFKGDTTRERMMRWLEANCDWSMILDFPTGGINMGTIDQHTTRLRADNDQYDMIQPDGTHKSVNLDQFAQELGFDMNEADERGFATCMFQTVVNNDYFIKNRVPGATKFLNVVQGRTLEESNKWYEQVKHYGKNDDLGDRAFEGWSLAGPHKEKFEMTLTRLLSFRRDGLLEGKNWMHILGVGKLANGCAYTTMQRMIRKYDNPDFTISYDVSSPFTTAAFGNLFLGYTLDKTGWTIQSDKLDGRNYLGNYPQVKERFERRFSDRPPLAEYRGDERFLDELRVLWDNIMKEDGSKVVEGIFAGDAGRRAENSRFVETEIGKKLLMKDICVNTPRHLTSTWDVVTYALLMNHNVQVHLEGVFESQDLYDKGDVNRVPPDMLILKELIEEILDPANDARADALIARNTKALNCLAGDKVQSGVMVATALDQVGKKEHSTRWVAMKESVKPEPVKHSVITDIWA
jgi:hypothetical protein